MALTPNPRSQIGSGGVAAAAWVTRAVLKVRRFIQRRRRVLIPAPLPAAAPRTTVDAVEVRAIEPTTRSARAIRKEAARVPQTR